MNLHPLTFENLLEMAESLDDPARIRDMIASLQLLEKNLGYLRQRLSGRLARQEHLGEEEKKEQRKKRKASFQVFSSDPGHRSTEDEE